MRIPGKYILITLVVFLLLLAGNLYQFQNPRIVTVPEYRQQQIDSTTWVLRSRYQRRGQIIDSIGQANQQLADRIKKSRDQVASYVQIAGRLKTRIDSLQSDTAQKKQTRIVPGLLADTVLTFSQTFGKQLFRVNSLIYLKNQEVRNYLSLHQLRDIRLNVVTTVEPHNRYVLTYVNSPDFDSLQYRSMTSLKYQKRLPGFLLGSAATLGVLAVIRFVLH